MFLIKNEAENNQALLKEQATFIKASIALIWMKCLSFFYTSSNKNQL